jgi:hypothetical protein
MHSIRRALTALTGAMVLTAIGALVAVPGASAKTGPLSVQSVWAGEINQNHRTVLNAATSPNGDRPHGTSAASTWGEACVFNAPDGADYGLLGTYGHVGWAFESASDGSWEYGANEGPYDWQTGNWISQTWIFTNDIQQFMLTDFASGGPFRLSGYYTTYKCTAVADPNPSAADQEAQNEYGETYVLVTQDCESQVYKVLSAYGVSWLPNDITNPGPNSWYADLTGFTAATPLPSE